MKNNKNILIIDDEESIRDGCRQTLTRAGFHVETTGEAALGLKLALKNIYDIILLDLRMPKMDGMELLRALKDKIHAKIIIITGYGTIPLSVEAIKLGAFDFLTKPFTPKDICRVVQAALPPEDSPGPREPLDELTGQSDYLQDLKDTIRRVARSNSTVLLTGESGTGKELVASIIHRLSERSGQPFVAVDCSSLVENLMESELFGHVKGAFSGAHETRPGRFHIAGKGTLFLDEIANISLNTQAKLLRVIQEQEIPRAGCPVPEKIDVRLLIATNRDLRQMITQGRFREDLFYRISVVPIHIKPLRERRDDIPIIAEHFLNHYAHAFERPAPSLSADAREALKNYPWPGNVRELKNTMERICVLSDKTGLQAGDILFYGQPPCPFPGPEIITPPPTTSLQDVERQHIEKALRHFHYHMSRTAEFLGINRKTLRMKIRLYRISTSMADYTDTNPDE